MLLKTLIDTGFPNFRFIVEIVGNNQKEAIYYFENNWVVLRKMALDKNSIASYNFMKVIPTEDAPFSLILMTTYQNQEQYDRREEIFKGLMSEKGGLDLLNNKKPAEFRRILFKKPLCEHLD